jgi:hypothetical protein
VSPTVRNGLIAISFANLCFLDVWARLQSRGLLYLMRRTPDISIVHFCGAVLFAVFGLASILWIIMTLVRLSKKPRLATLWNWCFLLLFLAPLNSLRIYGFRLTSDLMFTSIGRVATIAITIVISIIVLWAAYRWPGRLLQIPPVMVMLLSPLFVIQFAKAVAFYRELSNDNYVYSPVKTRNAEASYTPRFVWIVFDELDQELTFETRPDSVNLPELDRLRAEAIYGSHAYAPAQWTHLAMSSMLTGRAIEHWEWQPSSGLLITYKGARNAVPWTDVPNVLSEAHRLGLNVGVAGFHVPYCRIIPDSLGYCFWQPSTLIESQPPLGSSFSERLGDYFSSRVSLFPLMIRLLGHRSPTAWLTEPSVNQRVRSGQVQDHVQLSERAIELAAEGRFQLILIHLSIPHPLGIYDRSIGRVSDKPESTYFDNLALVDVTLGQLRSAIGASWDDTAVLVTSDHPIRPYSWRHIDSSIEALGARDRVPFLLKMPHQHSSLTVNSGFQTTVVHDLILDVLQQTIKSPDDVIAWFESRKH